MLHKITSFFVVHPERIAGICSGCDCRQGQVQLLEGLLVELEIELACNGNSAPDARSSKFPENIKVKPYLAYAKGDSADEFVYFTSEVEVLIMEERDKNNVYFYLPGAVMERDGLKYPKYYYIELK